METNRIQTPLLLTSYLFEYPSADWWEGVPTHAAAVADVERPQSREVFEEFFGYIGETKRQEFEDAYVRAFDFSQNTNLYLTTHNRTDFGKQSEEMPLQRSTSMLPSPMARGAKTRTGGSPLRLAAAVPERTSLHILHEIQPKLELLRDRLIEAKLPYAFLLDVVLTEASALEGRTA